MLTAAHGRHYRGSLASLHAPVLFAILGHPCRLSLVRSVGQSVVSQWHSSAQRLQPPVQPGDSQGHWHTTAESATVYTASDDLAPRVSGSLVLSGVWAYGRLHNVVVRTLARD